MRRICDVLKLRLVMDQLSEIDETFNDFFELRTRRSNKNLFVMRDNQNNTINYKAEKVLSLRSVEVEHSILKDGFVLLSYFRAMSSCPNDRGIPQSELEFEDSRFDDK